MEAPGVEAGQLDHLVQSGMDVEKLHKSCTYDQSQYHFIDQHHQAVRTGSMVEVVKKRYILKTKEEHIRQKGENQKCRQQDEERSAKDKRTEE